MVGYSSIPDEWANEQWVKVNGIDRKNNSTGYSVLNCVSCCKTCNFAKKNMSYKDFIGYLNRVSEFRHEALVQEG